MKNTETLKKNYEFKQVLTKGKGYYGKYLNLYSKKEMSTKNKIGIAVGKKVGKAVKRNQIKRWIRESYFCFEDELIDTYQIIFVWKKSIDLEEVSFWQVKEDMRNLLKKAGML